MSIGTGTLVQYLPTKREYPMHAHAAQAAMITRWDATSARATLAIFLSGCDYFVSQSDVGEGTDPGSFQQLSPEVR